MDMAWSIVAFGQFLCECAYVEIKVHIFLGIIRYLSHCKCEKVVICVYNYLGAFFTLIFFIIHLDIFQNHSVSRFHYSVIIGCLPQSQQ